MAIPKKVEQRFDAMCDAVHSHNLALIETTDRQNRPAYVICLVEQGDGDKFDMRPLARMYEGDPHNELNPPDDSTLEKEHTSICPECHQCIECGCSPLCASRRLN